MKGRLGVLLVLGLLTAAWGCQGEKGANDGGAAPAATADAAADQLLAEVTGDAPAAKPAEPAKEPSVAVQPGTQPPPAVAVKDSPRGSTALNADQLEQLYREVAQGGPGDPATPEAAKAEALFAAGRKLYDEQRYEDALAKFEEALRAYPRHRGAQQYAEKTRAILNVGLDSTRIKLENLEIGERVRVQEALARLQKVVDEGNRFRLDAARSHPGDATRPADAVLSRRRKAAEDAMKSYDRALEIVRWMPYQVDLSDLRRRVNAAKSETALIVKSLDDQLAAYRRDEAEKARTADRARADIFFGRQIQAMLDRARFDYSQGRYAEAEAICDQVLRLDPKNGNALSLRASSRAMKHKTAEARTYLDYGIEFKDSMQRVEDATIPHSKVLVYPDDWQKIMLRSDSLGLGMGGDADPEWMNDIRRKLEKKVTFEFVQAPLTEAINFLQSVSEVNMIIDPAVKAGGDKPITLKMTQASLNLALDWILQLAGLDFELRDNAVFISTKDNLRPETKMVFYDIQDLILAIPDFPGPEMDLMQGGAGQLPVFGGAAPAAQNDEAAIVEMIKRRIRPDSWAVQGVSIEPRNGKLVVVQRPEVHRMISSLLADLRSTQKVMVVVEGRLLTIREGLFEDIGVNWGTTAGLPEVPTATPGATHAWTNTNGVITSIGSVINNNLTNSPDGTPIALNSPMFVGSRPTGGLSAEWNFINNLQLNAVMHALRIKENGAVLQAPKLVVHNGQRAHMWVGRQRAYISGNQASGTTTTPTVNQLLTGVVLDVKPIVSADRRYITMELRPTFTDLVQMRQTTSITVVDDDDDDDDDVNLLVQTTQLPEVRITRVRTSVTIPDGGIILTGGRMRDVQYDTEAGVPFVRNIPFLGRLFRWNRKDNERENLAILVTARTVLFEEEERKQF